jgi:hypothetical protein
VTDWATVQDGSWKRATGPFGGGAFVAASWVQAAWEGQALSLGRAAISC